MENEILNLKPQQVWSHFYEMTQIPRPTGQMEKITEYVVNFGKSLGLEVDKDAVGNVVIRKPASAGYEGKPAVILQAHLDMVPQKNSDTNHDFTKDPLQLRIDGDKVKATSTTLGADNGMGAAMMLAVLEDKSLKHPALEALFTIDEEVGMNGAFGLQKGFLHGTRMLNLDTEQEGEICVGCAGGADVNVTFQYQDDTEIEEGDVAFKLSLKGLKGGHSGMDIILGRGNANKLMNRFLKEAVSCYEARLSSIQGGSLRNAIPRESFAVVTIPDQLTDEFIGLVQEYEDLYNTEYKGIENHITFTAEKVDMPKTLIPEEVQDDLINAVEGCPNGVMSMLAEFPGTVESSLNLALVESSEGKIEIKLLVRGSSESRKFYVCSQVESVFMLAGAKVEIVNPYPGWQPNASSELLNLMEKIYVEKYDKKPTVMVIHAGLECGIIQSQVNSDLDIVSFGPSISGAHSPDEAVEIASVETVYDYLLTILERL